MRSFLACFRLHPTRKRARKRTLPKGEESMPSTLSRWKHFAALALIGDGLMAVVRPPNDAGEWAVGPLAWRKAMPGLGNHPNLTRVLGGVQAAAAMYWLLSQERQQ
jgi:hypothetical protein